MLEDLAHWIDTGNYEQGVLLYERAIGQDFTLKILKRGKDEYNRKKLRAALEARFTDLKQAQATMQASYPPALQAEQSRAGKLLDEKIVLKERLRALYDQGHTDTVKPFDMAFRILDMEPELDAIFGKQRFFETHGYLPEDQAPGETSTLELIRRRDTLRTYVTRYEKKIRENDNVEKNQPRLEGFRSELFAVDQLINALPN